LFVGAIIGDDPLKDKSKAASIVGSADQAAIPAFRRFPLLTKIGLSLVQPKPDS
jgi:hypothetical protein